MFDELEKKVAVARSERAGESQCQIQTLAEFTEVWVSEKRVEWHDSYYRYLVHNKMTCTKTDGSQREIYMSQPVFDALQEQYKVTGGGQFVFCNRDGKPLFNNNVTKRVWHPTLRFLGMKRRPPYQTRHTAATLWLGSGEAPEWIARQMGHTTTEMLFRVYSRYVPNLTRQDGSAFERLLQGQQKTEED